MKCPICQEELKPITGACEDTEYYCQNCDYMTGDENLWKQLIKYKQALDLAIDSLECIGENQTPTGKFARIILNDVKQIIKTKE